MDSNALRGGYRGRNGSGSHGRSRGLSRGETINMLITEQVMTRGMAFQPSGGSPRRGSCRSLVHSQSPQATPENSSTIKSPSPPTITADHDEVRHKMLHGNLRPSTSGGPSRLNELEDIDIEVGPKKKKDDVYEKYNFDVNFDDNLPIADSREKIMNTIKTNAVVILQGDTGCGKTTQVPQYILNDAYKRREYCNIICTQPRRIAAISIATRVCSEMKWEVGGVVGYQVGLRKIDSEDTRLLYCTTGVLLQKLIVTKDMSMYTHIILDEVHERDQDMDFLFIVVKKLMSEQCSHVKVILMSATIDAAAFSEYFKIRRGSTLVPAPIINVDTRRLYNVKEFYLCQLGRLQLNIEAISYKEPGISDEMYTIALKLVIICEKLDHQNDSDNQANNQHSILIFLPGIYEIDRMDKELQKLKDRTSFTILRLHSMVTADEQQRIFRRAPTGYRKVILSTNIAESSITVPDVKYVIDFCLVKSLVIDTSTNLTSLQLHWASRSNCKQRSGRAGRVSNGRVYRLVSKYAYDHEMEEIGPPEMIRCPLENVVLKAKLLDLGPPHSILALAMSPPNMKDILNTVLLLKELGALYKTVNGHYDKFDGDLSYIGRVMAALPIDVRITRLIIFGYIFSVLEEAIIIAAGLNVKSIFEFPYNDNLAAYFQKLTWSDASGSDLFAILKAYRVWCSSKEQHNFDDDDNEKAWARRYFINCRSMKEMHMLIQEIKDRLENVGIEESTGMNRVNWTPKEKTIVLKIAVAGAFYPNYFLRSSTSNQELERDAYNTLCGRDPCNTVFFTGFNSRYIGELYAQNVKNFFSHPSMSPKYIKVSFESGNQKIFVTFLNNPENSYHDSNDVLMAIPGRVKSEVYKAIKMRKLRQNCILKVLKPRDAIEYATKHNLGVLRSGMWVPRKRQLKNPELVVIPSVYTKSVRGNITHIEHCGKFWFQPSSEEDRLQEITDELNGLTSDIYCFGNPAEVSKGEIVAAPFNEPGGRQKYHRARIVNAERAGNNSCFRVMFIDYGKVDVVEFVRLRQLGPVTVRLKDIPPRVFECCLAEVQPSSLFCPQGKWPMEAIQPMQMLADRGVVELEIYSVVAGVAYVKLLYGAESFNDMLIQKKLAQRAEENYMSKADHDKRIRMQRISDINDNKGDSFIDDDYVKRIDFEEDYPVTPPPIHKCTEKINLKGPYSPLESKVYAAARVGGWKTVSIEPQSVNSVLLDADPQEGHERMFVAASVTENQERTELTCRQVTAMPNIRGFAPLMGMLFCPTMEIKTDDKKIKYASLLTGLGYDENKKPLFEEHDIVFNLDVEIVHDDFEKINQIRYCMDTLIRTEPGQEIPRVNEKVKADLSEKIKVLIVRLLEKPRQLVEKSHCKGENLWGLADTEDLMKTDHIYGTRSIFPLHSAVRLYHMNFEQRKTLLTHCEELHAMSQLGSLKQLVCKLCDKTLETVIQLRIHLLSQLHLDREYQIGHRK